MTVQGRGFVVLVLLSCGLGRGDGTVELLYGECDGCRARVAVCVEEEGEERSDEEELQGAEHE